MVKKHLHLQHHRHSGSVLHHRHTSYRSILFVIFVGVIFLLWLGIFVSSKLDKLSVGSSPNVPPPAGIPFITSPSPNSYTDIDKSDISGTCPTNTITQVLVYNGDKIIGSAPCEGGYFALTVPLVNGANILQATAINSANIASLKSVSVTVYSRAETGGVITNSINYSAPTIKPISVQSPYSIAGPLAQLFMAILFGMYFFLLVIAISLATKEQYNPEIIAVENKEM